MAESPHLLLESTIMRRILLFIAMLAVATATANARAQSPEFPPPQAEHDWLKKFVGQWELKAQTAESEGQPSMESTGTMSARMLGGFWIINEVEGKVAGQTFQALQTIGYDAEKKQYTGTWVDSMMNHLWQYEGTVDKSGTRLVLTAEGPSFAGVDGVAEYRDSYEFASPDRILTVSEMKTAEGEWMTFMTGEMTRAKQ